MSTNERDVILVRTGTANMASILAGLRRVGANPRIAVEPSELRNAKRVVLPGVGAFAAAMGHLEKTGFASELISYIQSGRPFLSICLGMQLLLEESEESPGVKGLGVIQGTASRFPRTASVPQLGWNFVTPNAACPFVEPGYAYFANSFRLVSPPAGWNGAMADHGGLFVAALSKGATLTCQFHPELSGAWGLGLLGRWLEQKTPMKEGTC